VAEWSPVLKRVVQSTLPCLHVADKEGVEDTAPPVRINLMITILVKDSIIMYSRRAGCCLLLMIILLSFLTWQFPGGTMPNQQIHGIPSYAWSQQAQRDQRLQDRLKRVSAETIEEINLLEELKP
jgi:hypothetical protein